MKKALLAIMLLFAIAACSQQPSQTAQLPQQTAQQQVLPLETAQQQTPQNEEQISSPEPEQPPEQPEPQDTFYHVQKPHWTHMPISYSILNEKECGLYEATRIKRAFSDIMLATNNSASFQKVNNSADIEITCTFLENCYTTSVEITNEYVIRYETICGHRLGLAKTTVEGNRIINANIELAGLAGFAETKREGPSGFYVGTCGHTTTEIHELLHAFGYGHSEDNNSIMYSEADTFGLTTQKPGACQGSKRPIDKDIAEDLVSTYSTSK